MPTLGLPQVGRVALIHDWLTGQRGGENVLLELCRLFPGAPIYTLRHEPGSVHPAIETHPIVTCAPLRLPLLGVHFRALLPYLFAAVEAWDLRRFDLLVSTSHCVAKGVIVHPGQTHISYIHTPARYLYDQLPHYVPQTRWGRLALPALRRLVGPLRTWDRRAAQRPTYLLANSHYVAARIAHVWRRRAQVLPPPVDVEFFAAPPRARRRRRGWVTVAALVPYKRLDLAIDLCNMRKLPLTIVGSGPLHAALCRRAGPTVRFVEGLSQAALRNLYRGAEGFLFCGTEDFGIAAVEAMAAGCPVLGLADGGLTETVVPQGRGATGVLFAQPSLQCMLQAHQTFVAKRCRGAFDADILRAHAHTFDRDIFVARFGQHVAAAYAAKQAHRPAHRVAL